MKRPQLVRATESGRNVTDYFHWRRSRFLASWERFGNAKTEGCLILDIGAGHGGSSAVLAEQGARVVAGDIRGDLLVRAQGFCAESCHLLGKAESCHPFGKAGVGVEFVRFASEALPFADSAFDGVVLFDVLEHVADPDQAMAELKRVLRPGGWAFIEFTPYYSVAGHHLYDYTLLPVQFLPNRWVHRYVEWIAARWTTDPTEWLRVFDGLNRLSIRAFHKIWTRLGLVPLRESYGFRPRSFEWDVGFLKSIYPLRELLTTSYTCLLQRQ